MVLETAVLATVAGVVVLLRTRREKSEEFVLTLPPGAQSGRPGDRVRLRATADDGSALEGDFVVARATGAWLVVRRR